MTMSRIAKNLGLLLSGKLAAGAISLVYIALSARSSGGARGLCCCNALVDITNLARSARISLRITIFCNLLALPLLPVLLWHMDVNGLGMLALGEALLFAFLLWLADRQSYTSPARKVAHGTVG